MRIIKNIKTNWGAQQVHREGPKITRLLIILLKPERNAKPGRGQGAPRSARAHSGYQLFISFLAEPGPSKAPFLKIVDFGGDPEIVILGTEST
jgi:hypothetical protein